MKNYRTMQSRLKKLKITNAKKAMKRACSKVDVFLPQKRVRLLTGILTIIQLKDLDLEKAKEVAQRGLGVRKVALSVSYRALPYCVKLEKDLLKSINPKLTRKRAMEKKSTMEVKRADEDDHQAILLPKVAQWKKKGEKVEQINAEIAAQVQIDDTEEATRRSGSDALDPFRRRETAGKGGKRGEVGPKGQAEEAFFGTEDDLSDEVEEANLTMDQVEEKGMTTIPWRSPVEENLSRRPPMIVNTATSTTKNRRVGDRKNSAIEAFQSRLKKPGLEKPGTVLHPTSHLQLPPFPRPPLPPPLRPHHLLPHFLVPTEVAFRHASLCRSRKRSRQRIRRWYNIQISRPFLLFGRTSYLTKTNF